jgi:ABC-2 type transport system ATP-binding protein
MITITNLSKSFGAHRANDNISLSIERGRITGLLGPNGAGKTTLIRMMTNIIEPDEGTISFDGAPMTNLARNAIGYLPEERGLYKKLTVRQQLLYFARLKGLPHSVAAERAAHWLERMDALDWMPKKVQELSKGMQQKVQFISTILHEPPLLILDEPFSGLDPVNASLLIDVIKELKAKGTSIVLSTHQMDQVEKLCDDLALIDKGSLVLSGAVHDVRSRYRSNRLHLRYEGDAANFSTIKGATLVHQTSSRAEFLLDDASSANNVIRQLVDCVRIVAVEQSEPSLHDIFVETVTKRWPQTPSTVRDIPQ